jgi:hypothetical protein
MTRRLSLTQSSLLPLAEADEKDAKAGDRTPEGAPRHRQLMRLLMTKAAHAIVGAVLPMLSGGTLHVRLPHETAVQRIPRTATSESWRSPSKGSRTSGEPQGGASLDRLDRRIFFFGSRSKHSGCDAEYLVILDNAASLSVIRDKQLLANIRTAAETIDV